MDPWQSFWRSPAFGWRSIFSARLPSWRAAHRAAAVDLLKKSIFNLGVHAMEPLLGTLRSFLISGDLCF
jgi:hypothetical protein